MYLLNMYYLQNTKLRTVFVDAFLNLWLSFWINSVIILYYKDQGTQATGDPSPFYLQEYLMEENWA